jgi:hypothetical protein
MPKSRNMSHHRTAQSDSVSSAVANPANNQTMSASKKTFAASTRISGLLKIRQIKNTEHKP